MAKTSWTEASDDDLVRKAPHNPVAFQVLYTRYAKRVFGLLATMKFESHSADDIAQLAWTKVWQKLAEKPKDSPFCPWLMLIVRNTALDHQRRKKAVALPDEVVLQDSGSTDVLTEVEENNDMERLRSCLEKLPETDRTVIQSRLGGMDSPTIAVTMGVSSERVHRLFHDAKQKLQRCLGVSS